MKERPILFSGSMVRAYRREIDPKTQTRRTRGLDKINAEPDAWEPIGNQDGVFVFEHEKCGGVFVSVRSPYGVDGDRLWCKEVWHPETAHSHGMNTCDCGDLNVKYIADGEDRYFEDRLIPSEWTMPMAAGSKTGVVSPLFLPRWASRDTLEVVSARPERLQCITDEDAKSEGICGAPHNFIMLWNSINGHTLPWEKNPWVWRVEFRRVQ